MMTIQYTNDTWVIQHLAVLPKYRKTAVINHDRKRIVDEFARFLIDEHTRS